MVLIAFVMQCLLSNYALIYSLYNVYPNYITIIAKTLFHLYPPFIFAKCYIDIARVSSFHFDGPTLTWMPGRFYTISDFFSKTKGKLRIGIQYDVIKY